jgi:hypothetical protein
LSSYVASHDLAVSPQIGAKDQSYCTVYYLTFNSNFEAQGVSKNFKILEKKELEAKINAYVI